MKKILIASTMLVATGGMAAADITFNGYGRFGLYYQGNEGSANQESRIEQRFRLNIVGTAETDGGVKFGARLRIETNEDTNGRGQNLGLGRDDDSEELDGTGANAVRSPEFNVQAGGFRLDVGNTSDVLDSGDVVDYFGYGVGLTSSIEQSSGFNLPVSGISNNFEVAPTVKARYSVGDLTVAASYTDDSVNDSGDEYQIGIGYKFGNYAVGIAGGEEDDGAGTDNAFVAASFGGTIGAIGFSILVADSDEQDDLSYGGSLLVPVGAATDLRFVVAESGDDGADVGYGVGFTHSLGGGVSLRGGIGENKAGYGVGDLGVYFDF